MRLTAEQRQQMLNMYNMSEAARSVGIPAKVLFHQVTTGRLPKPPVRFGNRNYYTADDLKILEEMWNEMQNRP